MSRFNQKQQSNWYDRHGVDQPEHIAHGITDDELEQKFAELRAKTKHGKWTQMGNRLTCNNCNPPHTTEPIPVDYLLQGTDDEGLPMLTKVK